MAVAELKPEQTRLVCDPRCFPYETTDQIPALEGMIGQERAMRAMDFGLQVRNPGYNIYMAGVPGTGKTTYAQNLVTEVASRQAPPDDWCYVYNFEDPERPTALRLPPGKGGEFQRDMEELVQDLKVNIPRIFESADFEQQRTELVGKYQSKIGEILRGLVERARGEGFALQQTAAGFLVAPLVEGQPISAEDYQQLPEPTRQEIEQKGSRVQEWIAETQRQVRLLEKEARGAVKELEQRLARVALGPMIDRLQEKWAAFPLVVNYLSRLEEDVRQNLEEFRSGDQEGAQAALPFLPRPDRETALLRYKVNLLVNNAGAQGAPVVVETNPTYYNLFGGVEYRSQMGVMITDFTMIRAGAFHRANGGYLILQAKDVLTNPGSWDGLKRALKNRSIQIENIGEQYRIIPTRTLRPEPIPLDVKIILVGNPVLHMLLHHYDEDFRKFFKVKADFDVEMPR
ncbi:MAG TPA: AAA family ATPase, partial [Firmicutes bacterium]|nr:AAA family ATPase [Bacillota bacterium]